MVIYNGFLLFEWYYVNRDDNFVDDGLKGFKLDVMFKNNCWLKGLRFFWEIESYWLGMI